MWGLSELDEFMFQHCVYVCAFLDMQLDMELGKAICRPFENT